MDPDRIRQTGTPRKLLGFMELFKRKAGNREVPRRLGFPLPLPVRNRLVTPMSLRG